MITYFFKIKTMPQFVENLVEELVNSKDFYPEKNKDDRKSIAYGIAYKRLKQQKKKADVLKDLLRVANFLDSKGKLILANKVTTIMKRISGL